MIIFLHGPDDYRREERRRFYTAEFQKKYSGLGVEKFDMTHDDAFSSLEGFVMGQSLFSTHKMAILEHPFLSENRDLRVLLQHAAKMGPETVLLLSEPEIPNEEWDFLLTSPVKSEAFEKLSGAKLETFIAQKAKEFDLALTPRAIAFLRDAYEGDTWSLVTELEKVSFLKKPKIDVADLEDLGVEVAPEFFELLYGLKSGNVRSRLATLEKLFAAGEPAAKIFHVLAYQIPEKLLAFAEYDLKVKSGKLDYGEALVELVLG